MFVHLRRTYYWPLMAAVISSTLLSCPHGTRNRFRLIYPKQPMRLFRAKQPPESAAVDLLGTLPKTKARNPFILVTADRFTKLTEVFTLKRSTDLDIAKAFSYQHRAPQEVLSDNGPQFASKVYQST